MVEVVDRGFQEKIPVIVDFGANRVLNEERINMF
jgi:hypothetical protein